jgi:hypothetical protein
MALVQIVKHKGRIDRVPRDDTPVVELDLQPDQRVVSIELKEAMFSAPDRKTVDWRFVAYVETRPETPDA